MVPASQTRHCYAAFRSSLFENFDDRDKGTRGHSLKLGARGTVEDTFFK